MSRYSDLLVQDSTHHLHPVTNPVGLRAQGPDMVVRAEGVYLYTADGRRILDIGAGLSNVHLGYGNQRLCDVASQTMRTLSYAQTLGGRTNPFVAALSEKLTEITPEQYQTFFFASTGSDGIDSAAKIALRYWQLRAKPEKRAFISRRLSYHGNSVFATGLTATWSAFHKQFGLPIGSIVHHADSPHWYRYGKGLTKDEFVNKLVRSLENQILEIGPDNIAAFVGDPVQTGGRVIIPPEGYWAEIRALCSRYDILLIADEVISGFGNTGRMFGFEKMGFEPDIFVMAKGISSGYFPVSAVAIGGKVAERLVNADEVFAHVFTNCGHPVGAAVALENISIIQEHDLVGRVRERIEPQLRHRMAEFLDFPCIGEVRVVGVMGAFEVDLSRMGRPFDQQANDDFMTRVEAIAWKRGLATHGPVCCSLITSESELDEGIDILKASLEVAIAEMQP